MIIGFSGGMGVGKSTAIKVLEAFASRPVFLVKFAQPLYDMQEYIYTRIRSAYARPEGFTKDRKLLQWLGTDWGRDTIREDIWVSIWEAEVMKLQYQNPGAIIVCDDVRFDNEAETLKHLGGHIIKLTSDRTSDRIDTKAGIAGHKSEAGVNPHYIDFHLTNNGTVEEFEKSLHTVFKVILRW